MMIALASVVWVVWALCLYTLLRSSYVLSVRISFITDDLLWPAAYNRLPSYEEMLLHPKHWLRWNKRHWLEYVSEP